MNQEKIGKFIAKCRKEKRMTQSQLAEKLGVTDKTVSRWENGHYLPDFSLFESICSILDIEMIELLYGEKTEDNLVKEEVDNTIINLVNESNKKIKYEKKKTILISVIIVFIMVTLFGLIIYSINKDNDSSIKPNTLVYFPTKYAQITKEDGWICYFRLEYTRDNLTTPYYYGYNCDNLKYSKLKGYSAYGSEIDANGEYTYEIDINHPSYIYNQEYSKEIELISNYFLEKKFNSPITLNDLDGLNINIVDKNEILNLYNSAISSKVIDRFGNYPNINRNPYVVYSITKNDYTWQIGYVLVMGNIKYVDIDLKINDEYLSDLIKNNIASEEQKIINDNITKIEKYIIENQEFAIPDELKSIRPYDFLLENISEIKAFENE